MSAASLALGTTGWFGVRAPSPTKPVRREKRNPAERTANAPATASAAVTDSAAAAGEDFLRGIYQRHGATLRAFVFTLVRTDRHWAEDIVQETLIRAWDCRDTLPVGEIFEDGSTVDDTEGLVWSMAIREALLSLSPAHRQTLVETLFRQRTVSEAAETLGISPGTVKSRAYYGLRALRSALEEMDKLPA